MLRTLVFDREKCLACRSCELACAVIHSHSRRMDEAIGEDPRPRRRISIVRTEEGIEALRCEQCGEPLCVFSCKSGALHWLADEGRIALDEERCLGCLMCAMVCAYGIRPDPARDRVARCDVCDDLETAGCVAACPTHALQQSHTDRARPLSSFDGHLVVVGSSAAGIAACEAAREHAPACVITLVTADAAPEYSRPLLAYALAGRFDRADLHWRSADYLEGRLGATVLRGVRASALDTAQRQLHLNDGRAIAFDRLVIASGARATIPDIPGVRLAGVHTLRDLDDLDALDRLAQPGRHAVVVGGGNVGLQACEALAARLMNVTVVVRSPHLLSQMADEAVGRRVGDLFVRHGVDVRTGRDVAEMLGHDRVDRLRLDDGELLPADLVIVGKGIEPNVAWLDGSGVEIGRGVVVDCCGRTSVSGVFAAGDCAEMPDPVSGRSVVSGIWPVAYEMGRAAASTAVGVEQMTRGALKMNASRFFETSLISIGEVWPERLAGASAHILADREDSYRKVIYRDGRLVGALLYGDVTGAGVYYRLYREGVDLGGVPPEDLTGMQLGLAIGVIRSASSR
jgi:NAD(P)H-nitrite reductase large subunit/Fe-S-cluster-containing hydrogenase component 2